MSAQVRTKAVFSILHVTLARRLAEACFILALVLGCQGLGWSQQCSDSQFIQRAYSDLLLRQPSMDEIEFYLPATQSVGRQAVAASLTGSQEYSLDLIGENPGTVAGFYQDFLGRNPTASEAVATLGLEPTKDATIIAMLVGSAEYSARAIALTQSVGIPFPGVVLQIFADLLSRRPTGSELDFYSSQLAGGASASIVSNAILTSDEYFGKLIQQTYFRLLHRAATQTEISVLLTALKSDARPEEDLLDVIAGAPEYCNQSVQPPPVFALVTPANTFAGLDSVTIPPNLNQLPAVQFGPLQAAADASVLGLQATVANGESAITLLNTDVTHLNNQISALNAELANQAQVVIDLTNILFGAPPTLDAAKVAQEDAQNRVSQAVASAGAGNPLVQNAQRIMTLANAALSAGDYSTAVRRYRLAYVLAGKAILDDTQMKDDD